MYNIRVGGKTESEQKEIIDRVEDAILATKSAKELGVIDGGGVGILKAVKPQAPRFPSSLIFNPSQIVYKALHAPIETILKNAYLRPRPIIKAIKINRHGSFDIDSGTTSLLSMSAKGIIDPAKVVIQAIKNASSAACSMLNTGSIIYDD
jgi:chaperonin GroEL